MSERPARSPGFFDGTPDLAVEVKSPGDSRREVADTVNTWLAHGTKTVRVADPFTQTVTVHRVGVAPQKLGVLDRVTGEPLLPGFELSVGPMFILP